MIRYMVVRSMRCSKPRRTADGGKMDEAVGAAAIAKVGVTNLGDGPFIKPILLHLALLIFGLPCPLLGASSKRTTSQPTPRTCG
jgi:hypothetical protein